MADAGLPIDNLCVRGDFSYDSGVDAAQRLLALDPRPSAIIASNDQMALATLDVAELLGIAIPGALSLISFDNTPVTTFANPPLTAIDQPIAETVSRAVELLIAASRGEELPTLPVVVAARLIERGSTGPAPLAI
jgi:LacI family transcriptional regulator